jgi:adenylate cyclase
MVEEITTALSRFKWLFVIARNSSFTFKGKAVDVKEVGRRLGVRYVLEGSVRKASGKAVLVRRLGWRRAPRARRLMLEGDAG